MCALRNQNDSHTTRQVPSYYARNRLYKNSYQRVDWPGRTSRRIHDGLSITANYGLDTTSDDVDSSPYSSPYYINGRYNADNVATQRANSASVQGTTRMLTVKDEVDDFSESDIETTLELWQGKQIKFELPYSGKVVGNTITLRNIDNCKGILSIYFSATDGGKVISETAIDLCTVSTDEFEHRTLYMNKVIPAEVQPRGKLYVRMEIWDELDCKRSANPFNTGKKIEIAATGHANHAESVLKLSEKNVPVREVYEYHPQPNRPLIGLIYNAWHSIPANKVHGTEVGARVSKEGYEWDIFAIKKDDESAVEVLVYDEANNSLVENVDIKMDSRAEKLNFVQVEDDMIYVDGYSPLQKVRIGGDDDGVWRSTAYAQSEASEVTVEVDLDKWIASGIATDSGRFVFTYRNGSWTYENEPVSLGNYGIAVHGEVAESAHIYVTYYSAGEALEASVSAEYADGRPVVAAGNIIFHNNRIYLYGFRYDPNLIQFTEITAKGPDFDSYIYRMYAPNESPEANTTNPVTAIREYSVGSFYIGTAHGGTLLDTNADVENATPTQVNIPSDGAGIASEGDICNYRGVLYSFDPDEGIRRFTGSLWNKITHNIDSLFERVDMDRPRKLWGYAYKLYFNYYDSVDGKPKCIVHDLAMNYQQYPWFQDDDLPFCDQRNDDDFNIIGIHPDYPCIMRLYDNDVWRRLDTPIEFRRDSKYLSLPGNAADMILRRVHIKTLANSNRWWWVQISYDKDDLEQHRGSGPWYRVPVWDTIRDEEPVEAPFTDLDQLEEKAVRLSSIPNINTRAISAQVRVRAKTFRAQANYISLLLESRVRQYN